MNITILCSSSTHPVNKWLKQWVDDNSRNHTIDIVRSTQEIKSDGDILFLISCSEIISQKVKGRFKKALIIHASDLPKGRGWSPHIWEIIAGVSGVTLSLLEVEDKVDGGSIWKKLKVQLLNTDLYDDINKKIFESELKLMNFAVDFFDEVIPKKQDILITSTYFEKRRPEDSELDIHKTIKENFNLMRVCDPSRFPAFFYFEGKKYKLYIERDDEK